MRSTKRICIGGALIAATLLPSACVHAGSEGRAPAAAHAAAPAPSTSATPVADPLALPASLAPWPAVPPKWEWEEAMPAPPPDVAVAARRTVHDAYVGWVATADAFDDADVLSAVRLTPPGADRPSRTVSLHGLEASRPSNAD